MRHTNAQISSKKYCLGMNIRDDDDVPLTVFNAKMLKERRSRSSEVARTICTNQFKADL